MKKKIVIIGIALIALVVALTTNSWAARERGGDRRLHRGDRFEGTNDPAPDNFRRDRVRGRGPADLPRHDFNRPGPRFKHKYFKRHHYRPAHRFKHKYYRRHYYRPPHRFRPKYRHWRHRPVYRHGFPGHYRWHHRHSVLQEINNYYSKAESYAVPADAFQASASVSDSAFSVSVGVSKTN